MFGFLNSKAIHFVMIRIPTKHISVAQTNSVRKNVHVFNQEAKSVWMWLYLIDYNWNNISSSNSKLILYAFSLTD